LEDDACASATRRWIPASAAFPYGRDLDPDAVIRSDRPCHDSVPGTPENGFGFAGDHGLVKLGLTVHHRSVRGHPGPGPDQDGVTFAELRDRNSFGAGIGNAFSLVRKERGEGIEGTLGRTQGAHLDPVAQQHDRYQQGQLPPEVQIEPADAKGGDQGRGERNGDGHRDQQHHPPASRL
jgi:hypothetical protein